MSLPIPLELAATGASPALSTADAGETAEIGGRFVFSYVEGEGVELRIGMSSSEPQEGPLASASKGARVLTIINLCNILTPALDVRS